ncbi:MAG: hypothetical protein N2235_09250 [Fischerella sp.]|nr:hypothetical protein [Fischerella sp.]
MRIGITTLCVDNQIVFITGASSGIGAACAKVGSLVETLQTARLGS